MSVAILPALTRSGCSGAQVSQEYQVAARRVMSAGGAAREVGDGRVDYVLEVVPGPPVAVVEAKRAYRRAADGLRQTVRYAQQLDGPVAYASNGVEIIERDLVAGTERFVDSLQTAPELWARYAVQHWLNDDGAHLVQQEVNRNKRTVAGASPSTPRKSVSNLAARVSADWPRSPVPSWTATSSASDRAVTPALTRRFRGRSCGGRALSGIDTPPSIRAPYRRVA